MHHKTFYFILFAFQG
uniref:Uncharacterized protein n=1 Tax=Anguilla anguilla TaxID=7936 RepID=A0A0E9XV97_ANGAN